MAKKKSELKTVSIIFPNYNGKKDTLEYLESLKKTTYPKIEVIVIDNASVDGSVEAIKKKYPHVKIIRNKENLGITIAENQGVRESKGEYLIFTDNDMIVHQPEWVSKLVETAESDEKIGIVVPVRITYSNQDEIQTPGGFRQSLENYDKFKITKFIYKILGAPISVTGVSLIKREAIEKAGPFDEKMFGEFGDTDMHYRIIKSGYKSIYQSKAKILHKGGSTWVRKGYSRLSQHYKERLRFILKNYDPITRIFTLGISLTYFTFLIFVYALRRRFDLSAAIRDAVIWNMKNWRDYV